MFVPIKLGHGQRLDRTSVTHVRLLRRRADTAKAQRCLDHISSLANEDGIASIQQLLLGWPPERPGLGAEGDMWHCLRHYANAASSGTVPENKGLIELGYLTDTFNRPTHKSSEVAIDNDVGALLENARNSRGKGGEGEDHRILKSKVASNPQWFGIDWPHTVDIEYRLASGDAIDVVFHGEHTDVAVEVKPPDDAKADLIRGTFQCVKYAAVLEAEAEVQRMKREIRVVLAVGSAVPSDVLALIKQLQVEYVDELSSRG